MSKGKLPQWQTIGTFPAIYRERFLAQIFQQEGFNPLDVDTSYITWLTMRVIFGTAGPISAVTLRVSHLVRLDELTRLLELLLSCGVRNAGHSWEVTWVTQCSRWTDATDAARIMQIRLMDRISVIGPELIRGEIDLRGGRYRPYKRPVAEGFTDMQSLYGRIVIEIQPQEDLLTFQLSNPSPQALFGLWNQLMNRLRVRIRVHNRRTGKRKRRARAA
jgi:hypothetical protein